MVPIITVIIVDSVCVCVCVCVNLSVVSDSVTVARQAPLSMEFSRQEYWSGLPFPFPGDLPTQGSNLGVPADSLPSEPPEKPKKSRF